MTWIEIIEPENAKGRLKKLYEQVKTPEGHVDNILKAHSLRPSTLQGHLSLYKAALHSKPNNLSNRERELVAVCVSLLNECDYCVKHHQAGLARHIKSSELAEELAQASIGKLQSDNFTQRDRAMCDYAAKLTLTPTLMEESDLEPLRRAGFDDTAILDLNQVVAYFAYANRMVNGLGIYVDGENLGLHPDEDHEGFEHR